MDRDDTKDASASELPPLAVAAGISALRRGRANNLSAELLVRSIWAAVTSARRTIEKECARA